MPPLRALIKALVQSMLPALIVGLLGPASAPGAPLDACPAAPDPCAPPVETAAPSDEPLVTTEHGGRRPACGRDVWSVITRALPEIGHMPREPRFGVERLDADGRRHPAGLEALLADPRQPLLVFVHGNRYEHHEAWEEGLLLAARTCATCPEAARTRTVIFSWPSAQQGILLRDSRAKYRRAQSEGHYLASFLARVGPDRPVALICYSYGSLIALEALEDLVHAHASGREGVEPWIGRTAPLHVVLVAAAVRHDALAPCGPYRETLPCIDRLTLLYNSDDCALSFFEFVDRSLRTEALGHEGMPASWVPRGIGFSQVDAAPIVGTSHAFTDYLRSRSLMGRICSGAGRGLRCPDRDAPAGACGPCQGGLRVEHETVDEPPPACPCHLPGD